MSSNATTRRAPAHRRQRARPHRQHAARAAVARRAGGLGGSPRQDGVAEPRRQREGPHRARDDRGRGARRAASSPATRSSSRPPATPASAWRWSCAVKGYKLILTMPEDMSVERRRLLHALRRAARAHAGDRGHDRRGLRRPGAGARRTSATSCRSSSTTPPTRRCTAARRRARSSRRPDGQLDAFVAGVGTGGTITGVGEVLKAELPDVLHRRGRAGALAGARGRQGRHPRHPGHRRELRARRAEPRRLRRADRRQGRGRVRDDRRG